MQTVRLVPLLGATFAVAAAVATLLGRVDEPSRSSGPRTVGRVEAPARASALPGRTLAGTSPEEPSRAKAPPRGTVASSVATSRVHVHEETAAEEHEGHSRANAPASGAWERISFAGAIAELLRATAEGDEDGVERARRDLTLLQDADPERAREGIFAALREARDETAAHALSDALLGAVEETPSPEFVARVADVAARDGEAFRRSAALRVLGQLPQPAPDRVELIARAARSDPDAQVRESGAAALGAAAASAPGEVSTLVARHVATALGSEPDPFVRTLLVHAVRDAREPAAIDALVATATSDREPAVRGAAVSVLAEVAPRQIDKLSLASEPDDDVRRTIESARRNGN